MFAREDLFFCTVVVVVVSRKVRDTRKSDRELKIAERAAVGAGVALFRWEQKKRQPRSLGRFGRRPTVLVRLAINRSQGRTVRSRISYHHSA